MTTIQELDQWLLLPEDSGLEFTEAKNGYSEKELMEQCAAIANENGGEFILGAAPPRVVGTAAFAGTLEKLQHELLQQLHLRVEAEELRHPDGRVLIFHIPRHRPRTPVKYNGRYRMRVGPVNKEMDAETLRKICNEFDDDFSARIVPGMTIDDLDEDAVARFKERRAGKTGNQALRAAPTRQVLVDTGLVTDKGVTYACLILLGKEEKIRQFLPQAEIIFEWRGNPKQTHHDFRLSWTKSYFATYDEIWSEISSRNIRMPYQEGFVQHEVWAFDEKSCREAVNNAVAHRDYTIRSRSIFINASPESLSVTSPGGFLPGITPENVLKQRAWRNRLMMEALEYTDLVERSGQGIDDIFEATIRAGKGLPDFEGTDDRSVRMNIPAAVQDTEFVRFVEKVINERQVSLSSEEWIALEHIRMQGRVSAPAFRKRFLELGLIEQVDRTKGAKYILSYHYYASIGHKGVHTREKGLSRDVKKKLILEHLQKHGRVQQQELQDVFPGVSSQKISNILQDLKTEGYIERRGPRKTGYWTLMKSKINISGTDENMPINGFNKPK